MAKAQTVTAQMQQILDDYSDEVVRATEAAMDVTAREGAQKLRATSPRQEGSKRSGKYARGWAVKRTGRLTTVIYNRTDGPLTHLLENGHAVVNQYGRQPGRARAIKHIGPVEEWAKSAFPNKITQELRQ